MQVAVRSSRLIVTYTVRAERGMQGEKEREGGGGRELYVAARTASRAARRWYPHGRVADTTDEERHGARERTTGLVDP